MQPLTLLLCTLLLAGSARAGETVIYRCTAADGRLSLQSMPCAAGQKSEIRRLSADYAPPVVPPSPAATSPAPVAQTAAPATPAAAAAPATAEPTPPLALPTLHHCQPRSGAAYYTDRLEETVRCIPMRVTGLDGNPDTGAGQACEVQRDRCQSVPQADACSAWADYLVQSRQRFASAPSRSSSETDTQSAQIAALLARSACAQVRDQNP